MKSLAGFAFYALVFIFACDGIEQKIILDRCVVPKPPMFGSITIDADNKLLKYKCDKGFGIAFGKPTRSCVHKEQGGGKYYDWSGLEPMCYAEGRTVRSCPKINDPENGRVSVTNYSRKGKAEFFCSEGYYLIPPDRFSIKCRGNFRWSDDYPTCQAKGTAKALAENLNKKFINKHAPKSADSEDGVQENLSVGKSGLDLVFALDTSSSIGPDSMETAKQFIKIICGKFGISNQTDGGANGTRIALLTFSDKTNISFNLGDPKVRSMDAVFEAVDAVKSGGGGTNFYSLLNTIRPHIYVKYFGNKTVKQNERSRQRKLHAHRAIFIITDAKDTSNDGGQAKALKNIRQTARILRTDDKFEVFAIGIGTQIKRTFLAEIASRPYYEHVFEINDFEDLKEIGEIISEENIDYGKCGISGNTEAHRDGLSNEGAWPWLGWITVHHGDGRVITCGGALLCDKWFVTLANCVTEKTEEGLTTMEDRINVYLGDHDIQKGDDHEMMVAVKSVRVHPNYTGDLTEHNVAPYDIALLELGEDNTTTPKLNKFVRPLCFPESRVNTSYIEALAILSSYKTFNQNQRARVAGWGHIGRQRIVKPRVFPWTNVKQIERELQKDDLCEKRYPGLDSDMFHCVGNVYQPEFNWCYGDIGGPLMAETLSRRYTFLGLALKTAGCEGYYEFSLFLNILHPEINEWVERQLRGCNRVDEPIPYVDEEPEVAGNDSESSAAVDDADAVVDNDNDNDDSEVVDGVGGGPNDRDDVNDDEIEWIDGDEDLMGEDDDDIEWDDDDDDDDDDDQGNE